MSHPAKLLAAIAALRSLEAAWELEPTKKKVPGMKYPIVESDRLVPFLQSVLEAGGVSYTRIGHSAASSMPAVTHTAEYLVYLREEPDQNMVVTHGWVSTDSHNDQAGGLTRLHRQFLKGLTGYIEADEDRLEGRAQLREAASEWRTGDPIMEHPAFKEAEKVFDLSPVQGDYDEGDPGPGRTPRGGDNGNGMFFTLTSEGFSEELAEQIASGHPGLFVDTLIGHGHHEGVVRAVVSAVQAEPLAALVAEVSDGAKKELLRAVRGNLHALQGAFAGTGYELGNNNKLPPSAVAVMAALLQTPQKN